MRPLLLVAAVAGACHPSPPCDGHEFVAFASDFASFERWIRVEVGAPDPRLGVGPRTVYLNEAPPRGATAFPRCTMLVKASPVGDDPLGFLVGRAKRGGGYNATGAVGWEWFDLDADADAEPAIAWRGPSPPAGRGYDCALGEDESDTLGDCNTCHAAAADADYVWTPEVAALLGR